MLTKSEINLKNLFYIKWFENVDEMCVTYADIIKDIITMKEDRWHRVFSNEDCDLIAKFNFFFEIIYIC